MSYLSVQPDVISSAATNLAEIRTAVSAASAAASGPTTGLLSAAADEVSEAVAQLFGAYGAEYNAAIAKVGALQEEFARTLAAGGLAYLETEIVNAASNALSPILSPLKSLLSEAATAPAAAITLVMGASGYPIPIEDYIQGIPPLYIDPFYTGGINIGINTPEGLYPLTGIKDLTFDVSAARGLTILDNAITAAFGQLGATSVNVFGYSQSAVIASMEMMALNPTNTLGGGPANLNFTLVGNPSNPNGGLLARFPGLALPSLGLDVFGIATPDNSFPTRIFTIEYDGFGDFPQYPLNVLSDINAFLGIIELHGRYPFLSGMELTVPPGGTAVELTNTVGPVQTHYYMIPTENLPILSPLRAIPIIGNPLAELIQPDMRVLVNLGYGSTTHGWSPDAPNVPTEFGVFPPVPPGEIVAALAAGTQEGIVNFSHEVSLITPSHFTALIPTVDTVKLGQLATGAQYSFASPQNFIQTLLAANLKLGYASSAIAGSAYATVLPTTDIVNAAVTAIPAYNIDLFGRGLLQAFNGDPVGGLINAFGKPIAADIGLAVLMAGFEVRVFQHAASDIADELRALL
ncbi:hypothetical protein A5634_08340 [Mycobacterium asiaticum]|uniref:PE family protein n=1 Tax=Mycobacterium asiaticum TaxID=1790 RepID=A0A1A3NK19_MYCAS|nr:PE-PPE domain-containing protein [Mycobacterium asiaticum]OBK22166.1 hypothetical protein A5634_08340 [Mycobacterium asiaticum]